MSLPQIAGHELQDLISRGSCGAVYRAAAIDSRSACSVKVFSSMAINRKLLAIGMRGLQQMPEHPGILRPLTFDFDNSPYFVAMPLVGFMTEDGKGKKTWETPTLETSCGKVPADQAWRYIYEVCDAMAWLHKHNLVHCNLKPRNVLLEDDPSSSTKVTDPVQGWIGGVHHFEATDHFFYMPPEQAEHPENLATMGTSWDAYAFGVLAYRLLTGRFPRANDLWETRAKQLSQSRGALHDTADSSHILQAVTSQPNIEWPHKPSSKWDERRKQIIERCLELDPRRRWHDLREVMHEFEKLEADYQIEDAHERIEQEKRRQARKVILLRVASFLLTVLLVSACTIWAYWLFRARNAERTKEENEANYNKTRQETEDAYQRQIREREGKITYLSDELASAKHHKVLADANWQKSQEAVDQFLNQLLQIPAGIGIEAEISEKQINDALAFYDSERPGLEANDDLIPERARNYFNTAQLLLRKSRRTDALAYLEKSRAAMVKILQNPTAHVDKTRCQVVWGRACKWLGILRAEDGQRSEALNLLVEGVAALAPATVADPKSRGIRYECASAWYELGKRARRDHQLQVATNALAKVPPLLIPAEGGEILTTSEQFLLSRNQLEEGLAMRDGKRIDDAMRAIFDAVEILAKLVEKARPNNQEVALTLAETYLDLGQMVARKLGEANARQDQDEAMNILIELVRQYPQWGEPRFVLARCYGDMASLERDKNQLSEALRRQMQSVDSLNQLAKAYPDNTRYVSECARQKGHEADLMAELGKIKEASTAAKESVTLLEGLMRVKDNSLDELDRKECGLLLAQLYGTLGHILELGHDNKLAKPTLNKASEQWERLKTTYGEDEMIQQGILWVKGRLSKLR